MASGTTLHKALIPVLVTWVASGCGGRDPVMTESGTMEPAASLGLGDPAAWNETGVDGGGPTAALPGPPGVAGTVEPAVEPGIDEMELSVHLRLALALTGESEYAAAWPHVTAALEVDQDNWPLHLAAAQICLYWLMDHECVRRHASRALQLRPQDPRAHGYLGQAAQDAGDTETAVQHYRAALALRPEEAEIAVRLGNLLNSLGQTPEAIEILETNLRHNPSDGRLMLHLAVLVEPTDPVFAEELYQRAALLHEDPLFAYRHLLRFYERRGRTRDAQRLRQVMQELAGGPRQMRSIY